MSLDLSIVTDPCKHCNREREKLSFNYTYNVAPMWYEVYPEDDGMVYIDEMTGEEAYPKIIRAIHRMLAREKDMKKLNPKNGWGDYDGFLKFLRDLADACTKCPSGVWRSWR